VSKLQVLADLHGLNFTSATVSAACKCVPASDAIDDKCHERSKLGYFVSEEDLIDLVRQETGTGKARNPIAFLVEACDDAVYSVVDLEDGVKKKVITWEQLEGQLREQHEGDPQVLERCLDRAKNMLVSREPTQAGLQIGDEEKAVAFRVYAIGAMVEAAIKVFKDNHDSIMAGEYHRELLADSDAASPWAVCKKVGQERVYRAEPNLRNELMGRRIICDLMDILAEGAMAERCGVGKRNKFARRAYQLMSSNYRTVFEAVIAEGKLPEEYCCMQLGTDCSCGMTDTFACVLHRQLTND
jgi:dGTPase